MNDGNTFFVVGGTVEMQSQSYVTRPADQELLERTRAGEFCYVLTARQMGKSSLMVRTAGRLQESGIRSVIIDLNGIGTGSVDAWYQGLLDTIERSLKLQIDVTPWWQAHASRTITDRFTTFLREVVLQQVIEPVVIFIDEIDSTLNLTFRDDFFAMIRAVYNTRASEPVYKRLTFVLLGAATPTDLIQDRHRTPFNIGRQIDLHEFSYIDARVLKTGLDISHPDQGEIILTGIYDWTNGHPYLTQKLCKVAAEQPHQAWSPDQVRELVAETFFSEQGRKDINFQYVQQQIQNRPPVERRQILKLYRQVYQGKSVPNDDRSHEQNYLQLYGLVRVAENKLHIRNKIYRQVFNQGWIKENTPQNRDLWRAVGASVAALLLVIMVIIFNLRQPSPSIEIFVNLFNNNPYPTARVEALADLFNFYHGQDDPADQRGLMLFYNLDSYAQYKLLSVDNARNARPEMVTVIRRIYLTLDSQDKQSLELMRAMMKALEFTGQPGTAEIVREIENWKRGRELATSGQYDEAIEAYSAAIRLNNNHPVIHYDRAIAYIELQRYDEALNDLGDTMRIARMTPPTPTPVPATPTLAPPTPSPTMQATSSPTGFAASPLIPLEPETVAPFVGSPTPTPETIAEAIASQRFINSMQVIETVQATIRDNPELRSYWQANQQSYPELLASYRNTEQSIAETRTPSPDVIKITLQSPQSGAWAGIGIGIRRGAELSILQQNRPLVNLGFRVEFAPFDDAGNPEQGIANAQQIVADPNVLCMVGHFNSGVTLAAYEEVYRNSDLVVISPGATNPAITDGTEHVWRVVGRDDIQGVVAAQFAREALGSQRAYVIHDNTAYGRGIASIFRNEAEVNGPEVIEFTSFDDSQEEVNFEPFLDDIQAQDPAPDLIFFAGSYTRAGEFFKQARERGITAQFLGSDSIDNSGLVTVAGAEVVDGMHFTTVAAPVSAFPNARQFAQDYREKYNEPAPAFSTEAYDATTLCIQAIARAAQANGGVKPSRQQVFEAMKTFEQRETRFIGISGNYRFTPNGDPVSVAYFVVQVNAANWSENRVVKQLFCGEGQCSGVAP